MVSLKHPTDEDLSALTVSPLRLVSGDRPSVDTCLHDASAARMAVAREALTKIQTILSLGEISSSQSLSERWREALPMIQALRKRAELLQKEGHLPPSSSARVDELSEAISTLRDFIPKAEEMKIWGDPASRASGVETRSGHEADLLGHSIVRSLISVHESVAALQGEIATLRDTVLRDPVEFVESRTNRIARVSAGRVPLGLGDASRDSEPDVATHREGQRRRARIASSKRTESSPDCAAGQIVVEFTDQIPDAMRRVLFRESASVVVGTDLSLTSPEELSEKFRHSARTQSIPVMWGAGAPTEGVHAEIFVRHAESGEVTVLPPRGYRVGSCYFHRRDETLDNPEQFTVRYDSFGVARIEVPPEYGSESTLEVLYVPDTEREYRLDDHNVLAKLSPRFATPTHPHLCEAVEKALSLGSLQERVDVVAQAYRRLQQVYCLDSELGQLIDAAGANALPFLNGLRAGSCFTMVAQLSAALQSVGVPSVVLEGLHTESGSQYLKEPGHAQVACYVPEEIILDPTCWTSKQVLDWNRLPSERLGKLLESIGDLSGDEAYSLGVELRAELLTDPVNQDYGSSASRNGHELVDSLPQSSELTLEDIEARVALANETRDPVLRIQALNDSFPFPWKFDSSYHDPNLLDFQRRRALALKAATSALDALREMTTDSTERGDGASGVSRDHLAARTLFDLAKDFDASAGLSLWGSYIALVSRQPSISSQDAALLLQRAYGLIGGRGWEGSLQDVSAVANILSAMPALSQALRGEVTVDHADFYYWCSLGEIISRIETPLLESEVRAACSALEELIISLGVKPEEWFRLDHDGRLRIQSVGDLDGPFAKAVFGRLFASRMDEHGSFSDEFRQAAVREFVTSMESTQLIDSQGFATAIWFLCHVLKVSDNRLAKYPVVDLAPYRDICTQFVKRCILRAPQRFGAPHQGNPWDDLCYMMEFDVPWKSAIDELVALGGTSYDELAETWTTKSGTPTTWRDMLEAMELGANESDGPRPVVMKPSGSNYYSTPKIEWSTWRTDLMRATSVMYFELNGVPDRECPELKELMVVYAMMTRSGERLPDMAISRHFSDFYRKDITMGQGIVLNEIARQAPEQFLEFANALARKWAGAPEDVERVLIRESLLTVPAIREMEPHVNFAVVQQALIDTSGDVEVSTQNALAEALDSARQRATSDLPDIDAFKSTLERVAPILANHKPFATLAPHLQYLWVRQFSELANAEFRRTECGCLTHLVATDPRNDPRTVLKEFYSRGIETASPGSQVYRRVMAVSEEQPSDGSSRDTEIARTARNSSSKALKATLSRVREPGGRNQTKAPNGEFGGLEEYQMGQLFHPARADWSRSDFSSGGKIYLKTSNETPIQRESVSKHVLLIDAEFLLGKNGQRTIDNYIMALTRQALASNQSKHKATPTPIDIEVHLQGFRIGVIPWEMLRKDLRADATALSESGQTHRFTKGRVATRVLEQTRLLLNDVARNVENFNLKYSPWTRFRGCPIETGDLPDFKEGTMVTLVVPSKNKRDSVNALRQRLGKEMKLSVLSED